MHPRGCCIAQSPAGSLRGIFHLELRSDKPNGRLVARSAKTSLVWPSPLIFQALVADQGKISPAGRVQ